MKSKRYRSKTRLRRDGRTAPTEDGSSPLPPNVVPMPTLNELAEEELFDVRDEPVLDRLKPDDRST
ncbi:MAG: hypothetical protein V2A74_11065 [bacterium]